MHWSHEELEKLLKFKCDDQDKSMLTKEVSEEEIKKVLFGMPANKSPGTDGFTTEFFKESWSIVGKDFTVAIQSFFKTGFLPKGVNSTILALIPKKKEAKVMKDYTPAAMYSTKSSQRSWQTDSRSFSRNSYLQTNLLSLKTDC